MLRSSAVAALFAAVCIGCVPPYFVPGEPGAGGMPNGREVRSVTGEDERTPDRVLSDARLRRAIVDGANLARRALGVPELIEDDALAAAASDYSIELARKRRLSHDSDTPDRRNLGERLAAAGATGWIAAGENLAMVHSSDPRLAATTVQGWLDSPGHRRNLLDESYARVGTGVARAADGYWYITQVYVRPAPPRSR